MQKIIIETNADFTPKGKRTARIVKSLRSGKQVAKFMNWYVGTRVYRSLPLTVENVNMTNEWLKA